MGQVKRKTKLEAMLHLWPLCKSPEKGREGGPWNQGQEGEDQREVLPSPNLPTSQSSEVPSQVDPKQEQDGCLQHYQAPSHYRVGHEEDRGQQPPGLHLRHQGQQASD